jgi:16S rRNA pseudouridine516 synthase
LRLDRFVSQAAGLSRSRARRAIRLGLVQVNGRAIKDPAYALKSIFAVKLEGAALELPDNRYFMLHKPGGVVCSHKGEGHRTVFDLLHEPRREQLHTVGRLDLDTTGLVLLTDDGTWLHALTSPRRKQAKTYRVTLSEGLSSGALERLAGGMLLRGEARPCLPAEVQIETQTVVRLTLREGRYHQVKRMVAAVGGRVVRLHRESFGELVLDPKLAPGTYRPLFEQEVDRVRAAIG